MARQYSIVLRDAMNDVYETTIGTAPVLSLRTGSAPANCAAADTGTLLASLTLPSDWMAASSSGVKTKSGTWTGVGVAAGTVGHYRLKSSGGTTHEQGAVSDLTMSNQVIAVDQPITVNTWTRTAPGA